MDNKSALFLALVIIGFLLLDRMYLHWGVAYFLFVKLTALVEELAFWR